MQQQQLLEQQQQQEQLEPAPYSTSWSVKSSEGPGSPPSSKVADGKEAAGAEGDAETSAAAAAAAAASSAAAANGGSDSMFNSEPEPVTA